MKFEHFIKDGINLINYFISGETVLKRTDDLLYPFRDNSYFVEDLPNHLEYFLIDAKAIYLGVSLPCMKVILYYLAYDI